MTTRTPIRSGLQETVTAFPQQEKGPCPKERNLAVKISRMALAIMITGALSGCLLGPDYKRPKLTVPEKWSSDLAGGPTQAPAQLAQWWKSFNDPTLDSLMSRAMESNFDLRSATARIREARASYRVSTAGFWPQLGTSGSYQRSQSRGTSGSSGGGSSSAVTLTKNGVAVSRTSHPAGAGGPAVTVTPDITGSGGSSVTISSGSGSSGAVKRQSDLFQAGFDASWELDVFGGTRREAQASKADVQAEEENRRDLLVSLAAELARNYFELRSTQNILEITNNNVRVQKRAVELAQARFDAGLTTELDVKTAQSLLAETQAALPSLEGAAKSAMYRLSLLLGREPGALQDELTPAAPLPAVPPLVPVGLPSDLIRQRPDVRRTERQLAAATARIGAAKADLLPKFSLTGSFGGQSNSIDKLTVGANRIWSVGPAIQWDLFRGGRILANIEVKNARQQQALIAYEKAVMAALGDVEIALTAYATEQTRLASLSEAAEASRRAFGIANELYAQGLVGFLNVLDAERSLLGVEEQQAQSRAAIITDLTALYKALGGGWDQTPAKAVAAPDIIPADKQ